WLVGTLSAIAFTSFHPTKMIGGFGGAVATDDSALWEAMCQVPLSKQEVSLTHPRSRIGRVNHYRAQIEPIRDILIKPFSDEAHNVDEIRNGWQRLAENVARRNERAASLRIDLGDGGLHLPEVHGGDAIWRYTFSAPNVASANWIARHLQAARLPGS